MTEQTAKPLELVTKSGAKVIFTLEQTKALKEIFGIGAPKEKPIEVIQIATFRIVGNRQEDDKIYYCKTPEEKLIFAENNDSVPKRYSKVELTPLVQKRLNDPENKKQFIRKEK